jgi:arginyl-tRNA synthetase
MIVNIKGKIKSEIEKVILSLQKEGVFNFSETLEFEVEYPEENFGDYSTNIAMKSAKIFKKKPKEIAEIIKEELLRQDENELFKKIEIAGPGFLNFYLSDKVFFENIKNILKEKENFGKNEILKGKKVVVEYTDPNPFKVFHIGHLMSNSIGEAVSRIFEFSGADVKRVCYQGDVGLHVAKAIFGLLNNKNYLEEALNKSKPLYSRAYCLGTAYAFGSKEATEEELKGLNKKIYEKSDEKINKIYEVGKQISLDYFESIYKKLGTKFDEYFFESETGKFGKKVVLENLKNGVFKESNGAVIFEGEKYGLHTRVFINSEELPTYEAKELGLAKIKYDKIKYDKSVIITGNEINEYFKVLLKAMEFIFLDIAKKTEHISHGMLRLPTGKMSSRTGDVIPAEAFIKQVSNTIKEKRALDDDILEKISIAAIKYSILKQKIGKDIIFDFGRSISFEGDSGVYLLYSYVRARSILRKAENKKIEISFENISDDISGLEKILAKFPEVVKLALLERSPHYVTTYLIELSQVFNSYYAKNKIVGGGKNSFYRVALVEAVAITLKNGLYLLGIKTLEKM